MLNDQQRSAERLGQSDSRIESAKGHRTRDIATALPCYEDGLDSRRRDGVRVAELAWHPGSEIVTAILSSRHIASQVDGADLAGIIAGGAIATALFAAIGVGVGAVVRNQVAGVIAALVLLYAVEPLLTLLPGIGDAVKRLGLGGLSSGPQARPRSVTHTCWVSQAPAALVLAAYALAVLLAAAALLRKRDVIV